MGHEIYFMVLSLDLFHGNFIFIGHERLNFHGLETNEMPMISP